MQVSHHSFSPQDGISPVPLCNELGCQPKCKWLLIFQVSLFQSCLNSGEAGLKKKKKRHIILWRNLHFIFSISISRKIRHFPPIIRDLQLKQKHGDKTLKTLTCPSCKFKSTTLPSQFFLWVRERVLCDSPFF